VLLPAVYILVHTQLEALETDAMLASRASSLLENAPEIAPFLLGMISFGLTSLLFGPLLINSSGYVDVLRVEPTFHFAYGAGLILLVALVGSLIAANRRDRRRLLFFSTITIACYALVAAFRVQVLETFSFETLAMTPRYHYTAQLAGTITLCLAISQIPIRAGLRRWLLPIWLVLCIGPYVAVTQEPIAHPKREAARHEFAIVADYFENVIRAQPDGAELRLPNRKFRNLPMSAALFPNWAGLFIILFPENVVDGKTIRFVERNSTLLEFWKRNPNSRIADLLVAP
jgi:hypothetical protein